jgi:hypothetical protein
MIIRPRQAIDIKGRCANKKGKATFLICPDGEGMTAAVVEQISKLQPRRKQNQTNKQTTSYSFLMEEKRREDHV